MYKVKKLQQVIDDARWFLDLTPEERLYEMETRGTLPDSNAAVPHLGTVRYLVMVEAKVPLDNNSEFGLPNALDRLLGDEIAANWAIESLETWVQYLDGPAAGLIA